MELLFQLWTIYLEISFPWEEKEFLPFKKVLFRVFSFSESNVHAPKIPHMETILKSKPVIPNSIFYDDGNLLYLHCPTLHMKWVSFYYYWRARETRIEGDRQRKIVHLLVHSLNAHKSGWVKLKPRPLSPHLSSVQQGQKVLQSAPAASCSVPEQEAGTEIQLYDRKCTKFSPQKAPSPYIIDPSTAFNFHLLKQLYMATGYYSGHERASKIIPELLQDDIKSLIYLQQLIEFQ